jgi:hypothetical protein
MRRFRDAKVLLIDEISMMSPTMLEVSSWLEGFEWLFKSILTSKLSICRFSMLLRSEPEEFHRCQWVACKWYFVETSFSCHPCQNRRSLRLRTGARATVLTVHGAQCSTGQQLLLQFVETCRAHSSSTTTTSSSTRTK